MQTDTPQQTAATVQRVEKAAADVTAMLNDSKSNRFIPVSVNNGATCQASAWNLVIASENSFVNLPSPTPQLIGVQIAVVSLDSSTIRVIPLNSKVYGSSSFSYSTPRAVYFVCDGVNWW